MQEISRSAARRRSCSDLSEVMQARRYDYRDRARATSATPIHLLSSGQRASVRCVSGAGVANVAITCTCARARSLARRLESVRWRA